MFGEVGTTRIPGSSVGTVPFAWKYMPCLGKPACTKAWHFQALILPDNPMTVLTPQHSTVLRYITFQPLYNIWHNCTQMVNTAAPE